jgi:hypothetical protein
MEAGQVNIKNSTDKQFDWKDRFDVLVWKSGQYMGEIIAKPA